MKMMSTSLKLNCCSLHRPSSSSDSGNLFHFKSSSLKPLLMRGLQQLQIQFDVSKTIINNSYFNPLLEAFVDSFFHLSDQPLLPSQRNYAPVEELKEIVLVNGIDGEIPHDFPEGIYIRNGSNPLFGGLKAATSAFGRSSEIWVEGEGMLHGVYFNKASDETWTVRYRNRHVETETFVIEKQRNKPCFLPAIEGDSAAVLAASFLNSWRFGKVSKCVSNTNIFEHSGKLYSVAENYIPQEIDISTLKTLGNWDANGAWTHPFTAHPKRAPGTGELVIYGADATKPFLVLGIISADGEVVHKVDLKFNRCTLCHDIGVTQRYNVILDFPLTIDTKRLLRGGPMIKYEKEDYARIGVMPRYGDVDSIRWFEVEPYCMYHIFNCFEDGDEVVVWGCKAPDSIIPGPDFGLNKFEWFSRGLKRRESNANPEDGLLLAGCYEWRLNMQSGEVKERYLTGSDVSMDFPMINGDFTGLRNKYGYAQIADCDASSCSGMVKYGGLAKLYFEEAAGTGSKLGESESEDAIKVEYHKFEKNTFCTGATFVPKRGGLDEDDGWIITFVHNEDTDVSKVYIIDTKKFKSEAVAKITMPCRVPYGFHGAFMATPSSDF